MKPDCLKCRGACCETLLLPASVGAHLDPEWGAARGLRRVEMRTYWGTQDVLEAPCPCPKLNENGQCSIYGTRPKVCQAYEVGGPACLSAISRRRTPEETEEIFR